jgi:hypothetical protein
MKYSVASDSARMRHNKSECLERWLANKIRIAKSLQPGAEPRGVERGQVPPLNPQKIFLQLIKFSSIPLLPTLNQPQGA